MKGEEKEEGGWEDGGEEGEKVARERKSWRRAMAREVRIMSAPARKVVAPREAQPLSRKRLSRSWAVYAKSKKINKLIKIKR